MRFWKVVWGSRSILWERRGFYYHFFFEKNSDNLPYEKIGNNEPVCIADEVPFEIPDSWEWVRLGTICEIARGGSPRPIQQYLTDSEDGINWIKISDSDKGGKYINSTKEKIIRDGVKKSRLVHSGDFLLTNSMSFGRPYILNVDGCIHDGWLVLSGYQNAFDKDYLYLMLSSSFAYNQFCGVVSGAVVKNLNSDKVASSLFPLPPFQEQKRIVKCVEEYEPYINDYTVIEGELNILSKKFPELLKKSILQEAVQGKLVAQDPNDEPASVLLERIRAEKEALIKAGKIKKDKHESVIFKRDNSHYEMLDGVERCIVDEVPFELPDSWCWCRLSNIAIKEIKRGKSPVYADNGSVLVFAQKCNSKIGSINISLAKYLADSAISKYPQEEYVQDNDIIVNSTGTGTLGRIGIYSVDDNPDNLPLVPDSHVTIVRVNSDLSRYIYYILKWYQPYLEECGEGSTKQKELKADRIKELFIPIPPLSEQKQIVQTIESAYSYCNKL